MVWSGRTGLGLVARHPNAEFFYLTGSRIQDLFILRDPGAKSQSLVWSGRTGLGLVVRHPNTAFLREAGVQLYWQFVDSLSILRDQFISRSKKGIQWSGQEGPAWVW